MLSCLQNPNVSLPLFLLGILLLYVEFNLPGKVVFAAFGSLFVSLALYGLIHTSLAPWAILLALLSIAGIVADLRFPTRNVLPALATATLAYALFSFTAVPNATRNVHPVTALLTAAMFTIVTLRLGRIAMRARRNKAVPAISSVHPPKAR